MRTDVRNIPDPLKIPHGWMKKDECMKFWLMLLYSDTFNYLKSQRQISDFVIFSASLV